MGRRRRKRSLKFKIEKDVLLSLISVFLLLVAGLLFISLFASAGSITSIFKEILGEVFGSTAFFVPVFITYFALLLIRTLRFRLLQTRLLVGLFLLYVSVTGIFSQKAGLVGMKIFNTATNAFGEIGASIAFVGFFGISVILIFNLSLDSVFDFFEKVFHKLPKFKFLLPKNIALIKKDMVLEEKSSSEDETDKDFEEDRAEEFKIVPNISEPVINGGSHKEMGVVRTPIKSNIPYPDRVWEYPPLDVLVDAPPVAADRGNVKERAQTIEKTLESFGIRSHIVEINMGPTVTQYALEAAKGTKIARITNLANDLALSLASPNGMVRIEAPIPGKSLIGIEVPNFSPSLVTLKSILSSEIMKNTRSKLAVSLGHDVSGKPFIADIGKMPHVLIAGSTGSGKSVLLNSFITTLLFRCSPNECKFILIDPKRVEFASYADIPHLLTSVIVEPEKAVPALKWAVMEMDRRYKLFENAKVRNVDAFNEMSGFQALPYVVIFVDELAELMSLSKTDVEKSVCRLAQKSRATGIHLILATQRPSVDVLTGLIKANIPCRISFNVTSQVDSRVIIDMAGAEKLLGRGDMLYVPPDASKPIRLQGSYVSDGEIGQLTTFLKSSNIAPEYLSDVTEHIAKRGGRMDISSGDDSLFREAVEVVVQYGKASSSLLQRKLSIGYAKAARVLDEMEEKGIVGPQDGSRPRDVLINDSTDVFGED
ncbi:MAG: DNA translocase FtsK [Patescibacteria group bacterium]|nr:DNA translocase FtsK [Patescibacteria group bacterium]